MEIVLGIVVFGIVGLFIYMFSGPSHFKKDGSPDMRYLGSRDGGCGCQFLFLILIIVFLMYSVDVCTSNDDKTVDDGGNQQSVLSSNTTATPLPSPTPLTKPSTLPALPVE